MEYTTELSDNESASKPTSHRHMVRLKCLDISFRSKTNTGRESELLPGFGSSSTNFPALPLRLATMIDRNRNIFRGEHVNFLLIPPLGVLSLQNLPSSHHKPVNKFIYGNGNQFRRIFASSHRMTSEFTETQFRIFSEAFCLRLIRLQGSENENRIKIESNQIIFLQHFTMGFACK